MWTKEQANFIPDDVVNKAIKKWQEGQPEREQSCASPSTLTECPRVVWLTKQGVEATNPITWAKKQRFMLGRITENMIADQLKESGKLLWHWRDDYSGQSKKFEHGQGFDKLAGTPDLLLRLHKTAISDSKTGRSDGYGYVSRDYLTVFDDPYWYKYKLQLTAYYMLCHWNKEWFRERNLPLPLICHLFSYALDDGIVRRAFVWKPEKDDIEAVVKYTRRWNKAYQSETMPKCVCIKEDKVKFCKYGYQFETTKKGSTLAIKCCKEA